MTFLIGARSLGGRREQRQGTDGQTGWIGDTKMAAARWRCPVSASSTWEQETGRRARDSRHARTHTLTLRGQRYSEAGWGKRERELV